ncbi:E3 ubiquitin-protein ligase SIAH2 isoform X3 [Lepisosteus oculatus]|uniref:E3 ubiquitin-protein ligase SIAH2 isoform X3 n=1 Tax=Lepisosteus oculatus TaxID=7918 RepID=UPI0035F50A8F
MDPLRPFQQDIPVQRWPFYFEIPGWRLVQFSNKLRSPEKVQQTLIFRGAKQLCSSDGRKKAIAHRLRTAILRRQATAVFNGYASTGCSLTLHHSQKPEHEDVCEFRPYACPCPGASCKWQGSLEAVMPHLMHAHKSITTLQGEDIVFLATDINLPGAVDWVMMQSCFGHHFMLVLEKQEKYEGHQQFFAIVLLIGTRKQAESFAYRLELNGHRRRLTWEATPRSIHDGVAAAIMNSDCLAFDTAIAHLFADSGNLGINVTISTCCP